MASEREREEMRLLMQMSEFHIGQKVTVELRREVLKITTVKSVNSWLRLADGSQWYPDGTGFNAPVNGQRVRPYEPFDDQALARWNDIRTIVEAGKIHDFWARLDAKDLATVAKIVKAHSHPEVDPSYE